MAAGAGAVAAGVGATAVGDGPGRPGCDAGGRASRVTGPAGPRTEGLAGRSARTRLGASLLAVA